MPNIVDLVHQRRHPVEAEAEGKAGIDRRVDIHGPQHIRMDHSRPAELDPARTLARATASVFVPSGAVAFETREIEFRRRLGEREVARPKSCLRVFAKQAAQPLRYRALEMRHSDAFVDA